MRAGVERMVQILNGRSVHCRGHGLQSLPMYREAQLSGLDWDQTEKFNLHSPGSRPILVRHAYTQEPQKLVGE